VQGSGLFTSAAAYRYELTRSVKERSEFSDQSDHKEEEKEEE